MGTLRKREGYFEPPRLSQSWDWNSNVPFLLLSAEPLVWCQEWGGHDGSGPVSPSGGIPELGRMGCCPKLGMAGKAQESLDLLQSLERLLPFPGRVESVLVTISALFSHGGILRFMNVFEKFSKCAGGR